MRTPKITLSPAFTSLGPLIVAPRLGRTQTGLPVRLIGGLGFVGVVVPPPMTAGGVVAQAGDETATDALAEVVTAGPFGNALSGTWMILMPSGAVLAEVSVAVFGAAEVVAHA